MMEITIQIPDTLGRKLQPFRDRLSEILERGLQEVLDEKDAFEFQDEVGIIALLASQPTPTQVLAIRPSSELQTRVSELLSRNKQSQLSASEEIELERYLVLEHLVRLAKAHAYKQMVSSP
jgi:hypothetical protein